MDMPIIARSFGGNKMELEQSRVLVWEIVVWQRIAPPL